MKFNKVSLVNMGHPELLQTGALPRLLSIVYKHVFIYSPLASITYRKLHGTSLDTTDTQEAYLGAEFSYDGTTVFPGVSV